MTRQEKTPSTKHSSTHTQPVVPIKERVEKELPKLDVHPDVHSKRSYRWAWLGFLALLLVLVSGVSIFALGIYRLGWKGRWVHQITGLVPFPAAAADGTLIRYSVFQEDLATLRHYNEKRAQADVPEEQTPASEEDLQAMVLNRLIYDAILERSVKRYNIQISGEELEAQLSTIVASQGTREDMEKLLADLYKLSVEDFKEKIVRPFLWYEKLDLAVSNDPAFTSAVQQQAEAVLARVNKGDEKFEDIAKETSEDSTASVGGDLGFFGKGQMVSEFEDAAFALEPGQTSGLVKTRFGFHIIKVDERVNDPEKGDQVRARHILLKTKTADVLLQEQLKASAVQIFLVGLTWDQGNGWVQTKSSEVGPS